MTPRYSLKLVAACPFEAISLDEAKLHCRIDGNDEDAYIESLVAAAREYVEATLGRVLMPATFEAQFDSWPPSPFELPRSPLRSVTSVKWLSDLDVESTVNSTEYRVDTASVPGRVILKSGKAWPAGVLAEVGAIRVRFVAGYTDGLASNAEPQEVAAARAAIPMRHKQALKLVVGHLYENREAVQIGSGLSATQLPMGVDSLLWVDRVVTF